MACTEAFIDCTSLSFSYNIMGIVTITYTMVHKDAEYCYITELNAGGQSFSGYISDMSLTPIKDTLSWYETRVTLIATTD
jgi:hypothetical protein